MLLKYSLLLLGLVVGCKFQSQEMCNFEKDLCKWKHRKQQCHFSQEKSKPLAGETGYLYLSMDDCHEAGIRLPAVGSTSRFQLHYFINGTGQAILSVSAEYDWGIRTIWSCSINRGPRWHKANIFEVINGDEYIIIEAIIQGDMTIAIGNISPSNTEQTMSTCARPRVTNKPETQNVTTPDSVSVVIDKHKPKVVIIGGTLFAAAFLILMAIIGVLTTRCSKVRR